MTDFIKSFNDIKITKDFNASDKATFVLLISLARNKGYAYASNEYLAKELGCTPQTISNRISKLKKLGYIYTRFDRHRSEDRRVYPTDEYQYLMNDQSSSNMDEDIIETKSERSKSISKAFNKKNATIEKLEKQLAEEKQKNKELQDTNVVQEQQMESMKMTIRQLKTSKRIINKTKTINSKDNLKLIKK